MKSSYLPHLTLAALLVAALATLIAGVRVAREERIERVQIGRAEIGDLSAEMMVQLGRLDRLYEGHLRRLAKLDLRDRFLLRQECDRIVGIRQLAVAVDVEGGGPMAEVFQENFVAGWRGVPMLPGQPEPALGGDLYQLPLEELQAAEEDHGWFDIPGQPMMFWQRRSPEVYVVITPDPEAVRAAVHGWLEEWLPEVLEPVLASGAKVQISGSGDYLLGAHSASQPDVV